MIFIAVNTPTKTSGEGAGMAADLKYVIACSKQIAKSATSDKIIIEKIYFTSQNSRESERDIIEKVKMILILRSCPILSSSLKVQP